jgi:hypothetical protein
LDGKVTMTVVATEQMMVGEQNTGAAQLGSPMDEPLGGRWIHADSLLGLSDALKLHDAINESE